MSSLKFTQNILLRFGWWLMTVMALYLFLFTAIYFSFRSDIGFLLAKQNLVFDAVWRTAFYIHITGSMLALILGPPQFLQNFRNTNLKLHRNIGQIYLVSILLLAAPSGLYMSFFANGGFWASLGFFILSFLWIISTYLAFYFITKKNIKAHQSWMIRSYALTFSAVTLRLWVPVLSYTTDLEHATIIICTAWLNWIPNLIFAEVLIRFFYKKI